MEDKESTAGKKLPSIPANYVSLAQLQERWIERKEREKDEQKQEESEREFQNGSSQRRRNKKPNARRGKEGSQAEAVVTVTAVEGAESETNREGLKEKKQTGESWKKKAHARGKDKERIAVEAQKPAARSIEGEDRRRPQRSSEDAPKDPTPVVEAERSFNRLSLNHGSRRDDYGYMRYSSNFNGGNYSRQFAGHASVWDRRDRTPVNMMWVQKGMVAGTDGDACETQSSNKK